MAENNHNEDKAEKEDIAKNENQDNQNKQDNKIDFETLKAKKTDDKADHANNGDGVTQLQNENAQLKDAFLRAHADMDNLRKRTAREVQNAHIAAISLFARDLLSVMDNIKRAQSLLEESSIDKSIIEGIELVFASAQKMLSKHKIQPIEAIGEVFDPNRHEALFEDKDSQAPFGTITQIIEEGYMLGERLLRPARVAISAKKNGETNKKDG